MAMTFTITEDDIAAAENAQGSCPPEDMYLAEIVEAPEPEWRAGYQNIGKELSNKISFRLMDISWDYPITGFFTWQRESADGRVAQTMLNDSSKSNALLTAALGVLPHAGMKFSMNDLLGKRVKLHIKPKKNGYPNIESITPLSARDEARTQDPAPTPTTDAAPAPAPSNSFSRRTLKKINEMAQQKGYDDGMLDTLADREFGVALDQLTQDEADEYLQILTDEEEVKF